MGTTQADVRGADVDENATIVRGPEPAPATTVLRHMVYGSGLTHSLDYVVLLHALFRLEEGRPFTPLDLWKDLQAEGVRSAKNANELVGKNAVYESINRLREAKFIHRVVTGGTPGRFGKVRYEVYRQPAYHPEFLQSCEPWEPREDPHFPHAETPSSPLPGTADRDESGIDKTAGQTASRNAGSGVRGSGVPGSGKRRVPAGQTASPVPGSGKSSPPTPPKEEVDTSSPSSPSNPTGSLPAQREGEADAAPRELDPAAVEAARDFLSDLPGPWQCGRKSSKDIAPLLAEVIADQGWSLGKELVEQLTRNPGGIKYSYTGTLRSRIEDLPRYRRAAHGQSSGAVVDPCPVHPAREAATCVPCKSVPPLDDAGEHRNDGTAPSGPCPATEAALATIRRSIVGGVPGGQRGRKQARTKARRAAAQHAADVEFEEKRAEALNQLQALQRGDAGAEA
ncbi:hypothetical protein ACH4PU_30560 [Streptomyces sp. NPDC021100]|uniref:hypothetical protein n=1 Tax=Streptomyces sp. NPDC021100 TaxID=3365114 RepID=UPI003796AFBB